MFDVKSVDEVFDILSREYKDYELGSEVLDINNALERITAETINAVEDIPGFNRSSVDGYAVISSDTFGASDTMPAQLVLAGEVRMGEKPEFLLERGQAVYVPTGGELPENSDSMVMIEYCENYHDGYIYINKPSAPGENVVYKGDDIKKGNAVIKANTVLRPQDIGVLAAMGKSRVSVKRKLRVGIISTGDEIVDIMKTPKGSQVRDVNSYILYTGVLENGCQPVMYGVIKDSYDEIWSTAEKALAECDVVLISGGSSVGMKDETANVINSLGKPGVLVHGIAIKPGKPTIIAKVGKKAVIGLPGHPVSAYIVFKVFMCRLFDMINGVEEQRHHNVIQARLSCNYPSNNGREEFVPVRFEKDGNIPIAHPVFGKSGLITVLSVADGFFHIGRGVEGLKEGSQVEVVLF
jgi:molybdopterin molybdotransferase